ncbi:DNA-directed RNA polymerase III subunit RPC7-like [Chrysoperla carnea]|uniref:DNA-directed RNA polymerase III subunit RPC7-like n=1 Tax=Chrysoperla carnea TaxID=189513 RepID=UPI001D088666|nr:DNA-directed RNA polymerase III subunit RPC7-like [Chrysoperla carnea]
MANRGGRGGYGNRQNIGPSFSALGDQSIGPLLQPPPLYPPTDKKPVETEIDVDMEYLLLMDRVVLDYFNDLTSDLFENNDKVQELNFLYSHMPTELQPKAKTKIVVVKPNITNADAELDRLERLEKKANKDKDAEDLIVAEIEDIDEEMDEGTDYAHDYFDNGEMYEENDDGDAGPVY